MGGRGYKDYHFKTVVYDAGEFIYCLDSFKKKSFRASSFIKASSPIDYLFDGIMNILG